MIERAFGTGDDRPERRVVFAQEVAHLFRLAGLGKRGKPAQVAKHDDDVAAVGFEDALVALRDDQLGELLRQEALQVTGPLDLAELGLDPGFELLVPQRQFAGLVFEAVGLLLHGVVQPLDAQHRAHPREQRRLVDRLCQIIVAAGFEPGHHVLRVGPGGDQDDRDERQRGIGLQLLYGLDAVELRHLDVEEDEVGQLLADDGQRRLAVAGGDHLVVLAFEPQLQDLDIVGHIVDDEDQRRRTHKVVPVRAGTRALSPTAGAG